MVQVREVVKVFDGKEVLRHLNMSVERGTIYWLLGANGAGKSTIVTGLLLTFNMVRKVERMEI